MNTYCQLKPYQIFPNNLKGASFKDLNELYQNLLMQLDEKDIDDKTVNSIHGAIRGIFKYIEEMGYHIIENEDEKQLVQLEELTPSEIKEKTRTLEESVISGKVARAQLRIINFYIENFSDEEGYEPDEE